MKISISILSTAVLAFASATVMAGAVSVIDGVFTVEAPAAVPGPDGPDTDFVRTGFVYALSADVMAAGDQNNIKFVAAARHPKGRFTYGADSEGGSVAACESTPSTTGYTAASTPTLTPLDPTAPTEGVGACAGL